MNKRFKKLAKPFKERGLPSRVKDLTRIVDVIDGYMCWSCEKYSVMAPTELSNGQYNPKTWKLNDVQGYQMINWVKHYKEFNGVWSIDFSELRRLVRQALVISPENMLAAKFNFNNSMGILTVSTSTTLGEYRGDAMIEPDSTASDLTQSFNVKVIAQWIGTVTKNENQNVWIQNFGTNALGFKTFDGECLFIARSV